MSEADLLAVYDAQLRGRVPQQLPEGEVAERDGPEMLARIAVMKALNRDGPR